MVTLDLRALVVVGWWVGGLVDRWVGWRGVGWGVGRRGGGGGVGGRACVWMRCAGELSIVHQNQEV